MREYFRTPAHTDILFVFAADEAIPPTHLPSFQIGWPKMSTTFVPAYPPGCIITTARGRFLVEPLQSDLPAGYLLARRAERPMTRARPIRVRDILGRAGGATSAGAAP